MNADYKKLSDIASPLLNKAARLANRKKTTWVAIAGICVVVAISGVVYIQKHHSVGTVKKAVTAPQFVPFNNISEFNKKATGAALGDLQTSQSLTEKEVKSLKNQNTSISKS